MKIWQTKSSTPLDPLIERFTIGTDLQYDKYLLPFDCAASAAHAFMLMKKGHLKKTEFQKIKKVLQEIHAQAQKRKFSLKNVEDGHSAIENLLVKRLGELGGKIHLGRSRNDQSSTAIRIFARSELLQIQTELLAVVNELLTLARRFEKLPMPGYTHARPAMVSTVGHFFAAFAEALTDDYRGVKAVSETYDSCPLGAAAGYGVSVPIDRKLTARLLGFARVQNNTLATQLSRGGMETSVLGTLVNFALTLSRLANDLIYFSAPEFDFFSLTDRIATGSSIMPQKRNPDSLEIIRGAAGALIGRHTQVASIVKGMSAGYQRDLQLTKQPFIEGVKLAKHSLQALMIVLRNLIINSKKLKVAAGNPHLFAADLTNELVLEKGLSFRSAYREIKKEYFHAALQDTVAFADLPDLNPAHAIARKSVAGMPGNLNLEPIRKILAKEKRTTAAEQRKFAAALRKIWQL